VTEPPVLLQAEHVFKRYGTKVALRDVSFSLVQSESVALLGANGAGKTTLLRSLATLARPTRGKISAFGVDAWGSRAEVRARIGVVAHQPWLYPELSCRENLRFFGTMFGLRGLEPRIDEVLESVGLSTRRDDHAGELSRGLLQRLNLARAILHDPAALILDEPDTGLDAAGRAVLASIVSQQVQRGGSVVLTTHALELALELATRVVVVTQGRIALNAPREQVTRDEVAAVIDTGVVAGVG
jgi:heme exporter protein A